jgi:phenylpropionate dioxygenase-like ring-hydroxylating dioxygenase large terminal subunit
MKQTAMKAPTVPKTTQTSSAFTRFPRNQWYVAAGREELSHAPVSRKLLGREVVLFRTAAGKAVAMDDYCPHRGFPLSKGRIIGNVIQCGYHGIEFDHGGRCTRVPGQKTAPGAMRVTSYPVVERWHWVYIWMGDPSQADLALIPAIDLGDYSGYHTRFVDPFPFYGNAMLALENVLDSAHLNYVHGGFGASDQTDYGVPEVTAFDSDIKVLWTHTNVVLPEPLYDLFRLPVAKGSAVNRRTVKQYTPPCSVTDWIQYFEASAGFDWSNPGPVILEQVNALALTPADDNHGYHMLAQCSSVPFSQESESLLRHVVAQDLVVFEAVQKFHEGHPEVGEVLIAADKPGVLVRRMIEKLAGSERQPLE